jgi:hypothetical protein
MNAEVTPLTRKHAPETGAEGDSEQKGLKMRPPAFALTADAPPPLTDDPERTAIDKMLEELASGEEVVMTPSTTTLPESLQAQMGGAMNADFSGVQVETNSPDAVATGANALARNGKIAFAPGQYQPTSQAGKEMIGEELSHLKQQAQGKVSSNVRVEGTPINNDPGLEAEARTEGAQAVKGGLSSADFDSEPVTQIGNDADVGQRSPISWLIKKVGKKGALRAVKTFVKDKIKSKIKEVAQGGVKKMAKEFAEEADRIVGILEDPWWVNLIELIPVAGDIYGAARFAKQLDSVWRRAKRLERQVDAVIDKLNRIRRVDLDSAAKFRTTANNLTEQLAMKSAKSGQGSPIMGQMHDPRLQGMNVIKMQLVHTDPQGRKITIHYFRDVDLGKDFAHKFK